MRNTLLIIDDSELDRAIFNEIFKRDYRVLQAATAAEGMNLVRKNVDSIAAVVLDICLKRGVSGFAVMERIHQQKGCAQIPVILLTADPEPEWVYQGVGMGAVDFLVKPLAPIATQNRLRAIITQCWGTEEEQNADAPPGKISIQQAEILTQRWQQKFLDFYQNRDMTFASYVQRLRIITSALANAYGELFPESGLLPYDIKLIGMAAAFAEVGQLGLPDEILQGGPGQLEPGRTQFFLHTRLGAELFKDCPHEWEPLTTYCIEIAAYHHASYDGTGFPSSPVGDAIPLSAQLVHTAMVCSDLADQYEDEHDVFRMVYRALSLRAGRTLSFNMLQAVDASRKALENIFHTMRRKKRMEDEEKKIRVREALTVHPEPKSSKKEDKHGHPKQRSTLF